MAQQLIGLGTTPNDGTGDPVRTAFDKTNNNFTDLYGSLGGKASLASPTFTGSPTAPTAGAGTNTTQIATTAFVVGGYQPLNGGLTAISLLTTQTFGRSLLTGADAATVRGLIGLGSVAILASDTDATLAASSDTRVPTQKAVKTYVDTAVTGLLDFKGSTNCSTNPNYPSASKGDAYIVSAAGRIGGASGAVVDIGDVFVASADNAGGTQAAVGTSWFILEHNLAGTLLSANNLSDLANIAAARANLGAAASGANGDITSLTGLTSTPSKIFSHPGYTAGRWFYAGAGQTANTSAILTTNTIRFGLFYLPQTITISDLATAVRTTSAGGNMQLAIYAASATTLLPTGAALAVTASISTTTATAVSADITGADVTLPKGWYYCAYNADNSVAGVAGLNVGVTNQVGFVGTTTLANLALATNGNPISLTLAQTFGTWPNVTSSTFVEGGGFEPVIAFKVSGVS